MIRCEDVGVSVATPQGERAILQGIGFEAGAGKITWLRGPSGAGKSTLMAVLAAIRRPTTGQVVVEGRPVSRFTASHRDRFRQRIGFVHQRLYLFEELDGLENVLLASVPRVAKQGDVARDAQALLRELELESTARQPVRTLSGGERQRVAVARALVAQPSILLLDEPTAHQDDDRMNRMWNLLEQRAGQGACVVVAAHDPRIAERVTVRDTLRLHGGRLVDGADEPDHE